MKVRAPQNAGISFAEYFLYAIIILETAAAALAYKTISEVAQLSSAVRAYVVVLYFGVLLWVFVQLNRLHRKRKKAVGAAPARPMLLLPPAPVEAGSAALVPAAPKQVVAELAAAPQIAAGPPLLSQIAGPPLSSPLAAAAPDNVAAEIAEDARPSFELPLGLSGRQILVVFVVFLIALKVFSWVLANGLRR